MAAPDRHGSVVAAVNVSLGAGDAHGATVTIERLRPVGARWWRKMGAMDPMVALVEHGMLLESARGPIPNVAELVAGEEIRGSWWAHPSGHAIFEALNVLADSPDVVRTRLVNGKVTLIHRRLWPALVRVADRLPAEHLAAIHEEHTPSGAHRKREQAFPDWAPEDVSLLARQLSEDEAVGLLPASVAPIVTAKGAIGDDP